MRGQFLLSSIETLKSSWYRLVGDVFSKRHCGLRPGPAADWQQLLGVQPPFARYLGAVSRKGGAMPRRR